MITNEELQNSVQEAIKWEPLLSAAEIGVTAKDGVVTLTGTVDNYAKKMEAENATKNVEGVKVVVEDIKISFENLTKVNDNDIATEVIKAIKNNWRIPNDKIKIKVEDGWITLEGELNWNFQKVAAKNTLVDLEGVKGVSNNITIIPENQSIVEKTSIENAISRSFLIDDKKIEVNVNENKVTLFGSVNSIFEKEEAERIAWKTPGIWALDNNLLIEQSQKIVSNLY